MAGLSWGRPDLAYDMALMLLLLLLMQDWVSTASADAKRGEHGVCFGKAPAHRVYWPYSQTCTHTGYLHGCI